MFTRKNKGPSAKRRKKGILAWLLASKYSLLAPPIVLALVIIAMETPILQRGIQRLENQTIDLRMRVRKYFGDPPAHPDIQVVGIEERDLRLYGRWPWTRDRHAKMLLDMQSWIDLQQTQLQRKGASEREISRIPPKAIAFDIMFPEPESTAVDQRFGDAAASIGTVITGAVRDYTQDEQTQSDPDAAQDTVIQAINSTNYGFTVPIPNVLGDLDKLSKSQGAILPAPLIAESSYAGFVDSPPDSDGVRRRLPLIVNIGGEVYPSLVLQALLLYWNLTPDDLEITLGKELVFNFPDGNKHRVPITERGEILINWRNRKGRIENFGYTRLTDALERSASGEKWPTKFKPPTGKILIIGQVAEGLTDFGASPFGPYEPLVFTHATVMNNILMQDYLEPVDFKWVAIIWLLVSWVSLIVLRKGSVGIGFLVPLLVSTGATVLATMVFMERNTVLDLFWPISTFTLLHTGSVFLRWKEEFDSKQQIRAVFGTYVSKKVIDQVLQHPEDVKLGGDSKAVAIMFSDIRGFTSISESMTEQQLVTQLNEYFERMVNCLNRYEGTLHKYIGDAVMAAWGDVADHPPEQCARDAVRSCLDMIDELEILNQGWVADGRMRWNIGLGVNFGTVMVGHIGAIQRREFTLIGDPVNAASRFEGLTKEFGVQLCVGETVEPLLGREFITRPLGLIVVKGKTKALRVFEVMADRDRGGDQLVALDAWATDYRAAFEHYLAREFPVAAELFMKCLETRPGDICCSTYLEACLTFAYTPPSPDWDGVTVMKTK